MLFYRGTGCANHYHRGDLAKTDKEIVEGEWKRVNESERAAMLAADPRGVRYEEDARYAT